MNMKDALSEAKNAYRAVLVDIDNMDLKPEDIDAITRLASTLYIQAARTGGGSPAREERRITATGKQIPYFKSLMNAATEPQITAIQTKLAEMGYDALPTPKNILMDDMAVLIQMLVEAAGKDGE